MYRYDSSILVYMYLRFLYSSVLQFTHRHVIIIIYYINMLHLYIRILYSIRIILYGIAFSLVFLGRCKCCTSVSSRRVKAAHYGTLVLLLAVCVYYTWPIMGIGRTKETL